MVYRSIGLVYRSIVLVYRSIGLVYRSIGLVYRSIVPPPHLSWDLGPNLSRENSALYKPTEQRSESGGNWREVFAKTDNKQRVSLSLSALERRLHHVVTGPALVISV